MSFFQIASSLNTSSSISPTQSQQSNHNHNHSHYHPYNQINSLLSNQTHYSKTKRIGGNNNSYLSDSTWNSSAETSQNTSLSDFLSPSSPFSQNKEPLESLSDTNNNNSNSLNTVLFSNKLAKTTDNNNSTPVEFETLEIKAHKFILASRSGKFRELLKTNLIKICSLKNQNVPIVSSCDQCIKSRTSLSDMKLPTAFAGCSSTNCLYKRKSIDNTFNNSHQDFNSPCGGLSNDASNNNTNSKSAAGADTNKGASSTTEASDILCSSSYPSCSTTSSCSASASNNQDECTCCTCSK